MNGRRATTGDRAEVGRLVVSGLRQVHRRAARYDKVCCHLVLVVCRAAAVAVTPHVDTILLFAKYIMS